MRRTISTALAQRDIIVEIVVVDDGSIDGTSEGLAALAEGDPRVRPLRNDRSQGLAAARNAGLGAARAPWVAFLDDDDLWSPDKLRRQLDAASREASFWAVSAAVLVDDRLVAKAVTDIGDPATLLDRLLIEPSVPAGASNVLAATDLVRRLGGFDESFHHLADWDLWIRIAEHGPPASCPDVLVAYVEHAGNMHLSPDIEAALQELERLEAKHADARLRRRVALDKRVVGHWVASGHDQAGRKMRSCLLHLQLAWRYRKVAELRSAFRAALGASLRRSGSDHRPASPGWLDTIAVRPPEH